MRLLMMKKRIVCVLLRFNDKTFNDWLGTAYTFRYTIHVIATRFATCYTRLERVAYTLTWYTLTWSTCSILGLLVTRYFEVTCNE